MNCVEKNMLKNLLVELEKNVLEEKMQSNFNVFDVLKVEKMEIRHSNILAWLLKSDESHKLNDKFLRKFFTMLITKTDVDNKLEFDLLLSGNNDFLVLREWNNIDILLISKRTKSIIAIENKIYSGEHDNQLQRYKKKIEEKYASYSKLFLYLTLTGEEALDERWQAITHTMILEIVDEILIEETLTIEVKHFIEDYAEILRRFTMDDKKLESLCQEIYVKHEKAIRLIMDNIKQPKELLAEEIKNKENDYDINLVSQDKKSSYIRLTTKDIQDILPVRISGKENSWGIKNDLTIEIYCDPYPLEIKITFCTSDMEKSNEEKLENLYEVNKKDWKKMNQYIIVFQDNLINRDIDSIYEFEEQKDSILREILEQLKENTEDGQKGIIYRELKKLKNLWEQNK